MVLQKPYRKKKRVDSFIYENFIEFVYIVSVGVYRNDLLLHQRDLTSYVSKYFEHFVLPLTRTFGKLPFKRKYIKERLHAFCVHLICSDIFICKLFTFGTATSPVILSFVSKT